MLMAYAHRRPNNSQTPSQQDKRIVKNVKNHRSQIWFGKKFKGGDAGGLLKHKGIFTLAF